MHENVFHEIVNDDEGMYAEKRDVTIGNHNMVYKIIGIVQNHVSKVWSPPRVTKLARELMLKHGCSR